VYRRPLISLLKQPRDEKLVPTAIDLLVKGMDAQPLAPEAPKAYHTVLTHPKS
jgi:hypothetical protein